jgi:hypothetical protein
LTGAAHDRRSFLRRLGLSAVAAPTLPWLACVPEPSDAARDPARSTAGVAEPQPAVITRPVLLPFGEDGVHIVAAPREQPVAYVSMATRQLFVDFDYRDQVYWDLRAHISVSTGVWRIPLVGDGPTIPITPGDEVREFEELSMREWDPTAAPAEGDIRVLRGAAMPVRVDFVCAPLAGGGAWYQAGPWDILQAGDPAEALCREDFRSIGAGARYADRDCTQLVGPARVLTWTALEEFLPSEG